MICYKGSNYQSRQDFMTPFYRYQLKAGSTFSYQTMSGLSTPSTANSAVTLDPL